MTLAASLTPRVRCSIGRVASGNPLRTEAAIDDSTFAALRRRVVLEGHKWDPQVGDVATLLPFPLVMKSSEWKLLAAQAEQLAREAIAAEEEISHRPELLRQLGLPRALRQTLADKAPLTPAAGRIIRFDFHPTTSGWRISEANSDVPGGFSEASFFTAMIARHFPHLRPAGNPAKAWAAALAAVVAPGDTIALLSAPGYMEDHQVIACIASQLRDLGCRAGLTGLQQLLWRDGKAHLDTAWHRGPVGAIVKFYQAEWLSRLPRKSGWQFLFRRGQTPVANPALAVLSESKRFPLIWEKLSPSLPTWRALLPETRDPREVTWRRDDGWLLKTSLCNNGDTVSIRELIRPSDWSRTCFGVRFFPGKWVAQRRFESLPVSTPVGPRHACIGIYTVNGRAVGAYARLSEKPVIDFAAADVALLLEDDE